jgi:hypothetical protein
MKVVIISVPNAGGFYAFFVREDKVNFHPVTNCNTPHQQVLAIRAQAIVALAVHGMPIRQGIHARAEKIWSIFPARSKSFVVTPPSL